ncbi:MAG TPA: ABC-three component system protein [Candidatus Paceibacterota bacterium]|nr:ABC-three component system protein [Candidatus Paceibacterota bacterium]
MMAINRVAPFIHITERLSTLVVAVKASGKLNVLTLNNSCEVFYLHFLNMLFGWNLEDANLKSQNISGFDLVSKPPTKILVQVSATATKDKVESALSKQSIKARADHAFKFVALVDDASWLRGKEYKNPHNIQFDPKVDIYDLAALLREIRPLSIDRLVQIEELIQKELGHSVKIKDLDSNLTHVVNILAESSHEEINAPLTVDPFKIEKKINENKLVTSQYAIEDYKIHGSRLDRIYSEFDKMAVNKSNSIIASVRSEYARNSVTHQGDELFELIIENIKLIVRHSPNFKEISLEELHQCVSIVIVDAFIRCKIFKPPVK